MKLIGSVDILQCIGRRNYFPFLTFLLSSNLLLLYSISFTAYYISQTPNSRSPTRWDSIGSYILLVVLVAVMVPVGGLGIYHARLVWKNRTTIEMVSSSTLSLTLLRTMNLNQVSLISITVETQIFPRRFKPFDR
jgi:hypothetical protein